MMIPPHHPMLEAIATHCIAASTIDDRGGSVLLSKRKIIRLQAAAHHASRLALPGDAAPLNSHFTRSKQTSAAGWIPAALLNGS
ncbi:hypothetical protein LB518_14825 [Mesorhizobium sp. BR1-1-16]|uniref:hypothetical protein n=1 Tax=Mesorhizobium sp. BR1-1-16 TaxID=2876653 RepID=UPI001CCA614B|nr:hypothetical protein [Mesorhizobium sp. BR1-1-16]MBZ9937575.1 hypothetical protein [Mesorhizobium sp. BR1-1-16]